MKSVAQGFNDKYDSYSSRLKTPPNALILSSGKRKVYFACVGLFVSSAAYSHAQPNYRRLLIISSLLFRIYCTYYSCPSAFSINQTVEMHNEILDMPVETHTVRKG